MNHRTNRSFWERVAFLYTPFQERGNRDLYRRLCDDIRPYLTSTTELLELACGTGQMTVPLAPYVKTWTATDYAGRMVDGARKRVAHSNVVFAVEDATALRFDDASFDVVLMANALHIMPEPERALKEIGRVLRPGGLLIAPTFVCEGHVNRFRLFLMEAVGFKIYHKWTAASFADFVRARGFEICRTDLIPDSALVACLLVATPVAARIVP